MKKLFLSLLLGLVTSSYAVSQVKVICDVDGESVYLDGKYKSDCDSGEPVAVLANAGRHTVVVKKNNGDGSYYYFKKHFRIGDGVQKIIEVTSNIHYTEYYYYSKAKKSGNTDDYWTYLDKYPHGKYIKTVKKYLDRYYWNKCSDIDSCETYLSKVTWGDYRKRVKDKIEDIYYKKAKNNLDDMYYSRKYLEKYPRGRYSKKVAKYLDDYYWKKCNNIYGCNQYISKVFWKNNRLKKAKQKIKDLSSNFRVMFYDQKLHSLMQTKDGEFIAVGEDVHNPHHLKAYIAKLDRNLNILWEKILTKKDGAYLVAKKIISTQDGGYLIAGTAGYRYGDIWILKVDKSFNKIWEKYYSSKWTDELYSVNQAENGKFIIEGKNGAKGPWIFKIDKNGNKIWDWFPFKPFKGPDELKDEYIELKLKDGSIIGSGKFMSDESKVLYFKETRDGSIKWKKFYDQPGSSSYILDALELEDNKIIFIGTYWNDKGDNYGNVIFETDENGNKIWEKKFFDNGFYGDIFKINNNKFIVALSNKIYKMDEHGNIIWEKTLGDKNCRGVDSIIKVKNNKLILITTIYLPYYAQKLIEIDENGNKIWDEILDSKYYKKYISVEGSSSYLQKDGSIILIGDVSDSTKSVLIKIDKKLIDKWNKEAKK